jgi:hypothetical protein
MPSIALRVYAIADFCYIFTSYVAFHFALHFALHLALHLAHDTKGRGLIVRVMFGPSVVCYSNY